MTGVLHYEQISMSKVQSAHSDFKILPRIRNKIRALEPIPKKNALKRLPTSEEIAPKNIPDAAFVGNMVTISLNVQNDLVHQTNKPTFTKISRVSTRCLCIPTAI